MDRGLSKYKFEPTELTNMRQNGVRSLLVMCFGCRHEVILNVDEYPGDLLVREFGPRMVCTKCGMVGADVRPNWKGREKCGAVRETLTETQWRSSTDGAGGRFSPGVTCLSMKRLVASESVSSGSSYVWFQT
jgi:hypothetical protein